MQNHIARQLTRITFRIETRGRIFWGTVRLQPGGWDRMIAHENGQIFFYGGVIANGLQPTPCQAIEALLTNLDSCWGWQPHAPVHIV